MVCLESLCASNPLDTFEVPATSKARLFQRVPDQDPYMLAYGSVPPQRVKTAKIGDRYKRAVSHEMSKQISAGSYKFCRLDDVITDPKFQADHLRHTKVYPTKELMGMIFQAEADSKALPVSDRELEMEKRVSAISQMNAQFASDILGGSSHGGDLDYSMANEAVVAGNSNQMNIRVNPSRAGEPQPLNQFAYMDSMFQNSFDNAGLPQQLVEQLAGGQEELPHFPRQTAPDTKVIQLSQKHFVDKGFSPSSAVMMSNANVYKSNETDPSAPLTSAEQLRIQAHAGVMNSSQGLPDQVLQSFNLDKADANSDYRSNGGTSGQRFGANYAQAINTANSKNSAASGSNAAQNVGEAKYSHTHSEQVERADVQYEPERAAEANADIPPLQRASADNYN